MSKPLPLIIRGIDMAESIDSLQIEINAQASKANDSINKLVTKIDSLSAKLNGLDGNKLTVLGNGVQRLGTAMQTMNNVKTADFSRLATNLNKLNDLKVANLQSLSKNILSIGNSIKGLEGTTKGAEQITQLAKAMAQLGYKSSTKAIENIPKLAVAMRQLMTELSKAPMVSNNLINITNALAKLARTGSSSGKAATSLSKSLNVLSTASSGAVKSSFSLASAIGKVYATYWLLFRAFGKIKEAIDISSALTEVQNVVDVTFGDMAYKVEELAKTSIQQFGMSELSLKQYSSRFQAMGTAMGINTSLIENANKYLSEQTDGYVGLSDSLSDVSLNLTKLAADMASFYNVEQADVAEDLEAVFTGMTRPLRAYGLDLTEATLKEWALKNGLDANIDSMSQAQKTMLRYQYVIANTTAAQGDFLRTQGTWANQTRILSQNMQQLASIIGRVFINAFKPFVRALNEAMLGITQFATTVSNALGKIFGWKYEENTGGVTSDYEDAADAAGDMADNTGTAADNAKKLKNYLLGIDELNVFDNSQDTVSSSGGTTAGASAGTATQATGGQWVQTDKGYDSWINSLEQLGEYIGDTIRKSLNKIDWNSVYASAIGFGTGLADFLNGLISPELFGTVGKTIANSLNTAIYVALSFGETFDFTEFGLSIATGINNFFANFDFASLAQTLNAWANGLFDAIKTAISNIDWMKIYDGIIEFLENLDFGTVSIIIGAVAIKKIGKIILAKGFVQWIGQAISSLITNVPITLKNIQILAGGGLLESTGLLSNLANVFAMVAGGAGTLNEALYATFGGLATNIGGITSIIGGAMLAVTNFFSMWQNGFSWLKEALMLLGTAIATIGAIILGVSAAPAVLVGAVVAGVATIVVVIHDNWDKITEFTNELVENIKNFFSPLVDFVKNNIIEPITKRFDEFKQGISIIFKFIGKIISDEFNAKKNFVINNFIEPINEKYNKFKDTISGIFSSIGTAIASAFLESPIYQNFILPLIGHIQYAAEWIKNKFNSIGVFFVNVARTFANVFIGIIENGINAPIRAINKFLKGFNNIVSAIAKITGDKWNGVELFQEVSIPRFEFGGYPQMGDIFIANEAGPELVGTINGRTAVGSGSEITGISNAIYDTSQEELTLLRRQNELLTRILEKDNSVYLGDRDIARANARGMKSMGITIIT